jgi:hypothetical protein
VSAKTAARITRTIIFLNLSLAAKTEHPRRNRNVAFCRVCAFTKHRKIEKEAVFSTLKRTTERKKKKEKQTHPPQPSRSCPT